MNPESVGGLYKTIINRELGNDWRSVDRRVRIIETLERESGQTFFNTAEFRAKMEHYLVASSGLSGERLRAARLDKGLAVGELAKMLGVSRRHWHRMENGKTPLSLPVSDFLKTAFSGKCDIKRVPLVNGGGASKMSHFGADSKQDAGTISGVSENDKLNSEEYEDD